MATPTVPEDRAARPGGPAHPPSLATTRAASHQPGRAAVAMLLAIGLLALMDAGMKLLAPHYPALQVGALRGAASLPLLLAWALATVGGRALLRARWSLHMVRGALAVAMMAGFVYALRSLPLTTAYTIVFVAPLLIAALSVPVLGEYVGPRRWTAIAIGLAGVLVVIRPTGEGMFTLAALAALLAAVAYAVSALLVPILARTESTQSMVVWVMAFLAIGAGALALPGWVPVRAEHALVIAGVGVAGALGQVAITEAFRLGQASQVAPLEYTALVWGVGLDLALWGVLPDTATWVGAGIIIASGLYLLRRERIHLESEHP